MTVPDDKEPLNVFLAPRIKQIVRDLATELGISLAAASAILIDEGDRARRTRQDSPQAEVSA